MVVETLNKLEQKLPYNQKLACKLTGLMVIHLPRS